MSNIPSTPADGNVLTLLVPAVAVTGAPTLIEVNAAGKKDISCYLTPGGFALSGSQADVSDDRECDTLVQKSPGRETWDLTITGIDNTGNAALETASNALAAAMVKGTPVVFVRRYGLPYTTAAATAQKVDVIKAIVGMKARIAPEANSVLRATWTLFVTDVRQDVAIA